MKKFFNEKKIYKTKFGNKYEIQNYSYTKSVRFVSATSVNSFIAEAQYLEKFKVSGCSCNVTLELNQKHNILITHQNLSKNVRIIKLNKPKSFLDKGCNFDKIEFGEQSAPLTFDNKTLQSLKIILKSNETIKNFETAECVINLWKFLKFGVNLESITFNTYVFRPKMTIPHLYRMINLKVLHISGCFHNADVKERLEEDKFFRTFSMCDLIHFKFFHSLDPRSEKQTLKINGVINDSLLEYKDRNFQRLFHLNVTSSRCKVQIRLLDWYTKEHCKFLLAKILKSFESVSSYELPWRQIEDFGSSINETIKIQTWIIGETEKLINRKYLL